MIESLTLVILIAAGLVVIWVLFGIVLPYIFLPNFLFKERLRKSKSIKKIVRNLKSPNKEETLKNIYHYANKYFKGNPYQYYHLDGLFKLQNYPINRLLFLHKKEFFWCYTQIKVIANLLINTGQFLRKDIKIEKTLSMPFFTLHQYLIVKIGKKKIKVDPFYNIFKPVK